MKPEENLEKLPLRELVITGGIAVEAISLVNMPAIELDFMLFSQNAAGAVTMAKVDAEKRVMTGPAMIPNKRIYRRDPETNEEYCAFFSTETVELASQMYLIGAKQSNVNIEHEVPVAKVTLVESWLVSDAKNDKAAALGYDVPAGTWMVSLKVDDEQLWNDVIKTGEVRGFSIEGFFVQRYSARAAEKEESIIEKVRKLLESIDEE